MTESRRRRETALAARQLREIRLAWREAQLGRRMPSSFPRRDPSRPVRG